MIQQTSSKCIQNTPANAGRLLPCYKKFELMLTRRAKVYSSSGSAV